MAKRPKRGEATSAGGQKLTQSPFAALAGLHAMSAPQPAETTGAETSEGTTRAESTASPPGDPSAAPRLNRKIVVRREKKGRGGKTVTRISGLPVEDRQTLAKRMKKNLGCGASLDGDDVILLGSLVDRAAAWLEALGARRVIRAN